MPVYDDNITKTPKPSAPSYTVVAKGTRPTTTKVPKPYPAEALALHTEDSVEIFCEDSRVLTIQGTF